MKIKRIRITRTLAYEGDEEWVRGCMERRVVRLSAELGGHTPRVIEEVSIQEVVIEDAGGS